MKKNISKILVLIISLLIFVSCSPSILKRELRFSRSKLDLEVGQTENLFLSIVPSNQSIPEAVWTVSDEKIAQVNNGLVKAVSVGECVITAKTTDGKLSAEINVTVNPKSALELKLNKSSLNLEVGSSEKLNLAIDPPDAAAPEVQWISSNDKVANVDNTGLIKAVSVGTTVVTAESKDGFLTDACNIIVSTKAAESAKIVKGIKFNVSALILQEGANEKLQVVLNPADADNKSVTFSSSNSKIAEVDSSGLVKAIAPGTSDITVKAADGGFTAKCTITVRAKPDNTKSSAPIEFKPVKPHPNAIFRKTTKYYMTVYVYEHVGWVALVGDTADLEIYIENDRIWIRFLDRHMFFNDKDVGPVNYNYSTGAGISVKNPSTGEIIFERERTDK